ncbi:MAG: hypothetical protein QOE73_2144 [Verrucomicrobiota bacterium]|jgi:hypothetical protein
MSKNSHSILKFAAACAVVALTMGATQAAVLDLGSSGTGFLGGAYFSTTAVQPTGTGVFDPFLTVQNSPWEQGYNSANGNFDTKRVPQWNHEIQFSDLQVTTISGIGYFGFQVDVNEPNGGGKTTISLDGLQIFTSATLQNSTSTGANGIFNGSLGNLVFDLGSNILKYTDQQNGSGSGDINIFIPVSLFAGVQPSDYIYMYQRWGNTQLSEGGFEETRIIQGVAPIPEMGTFFPLIGLMVAVFSTHALRRRRQLQLARIEGR